ncbi:MAG: prepilin-type N-terminal cleavage/methylation domain-containing protein [Sulfurospirillum sp.]|nr:prepilin-type N-terminal cleavage/methylation domain-containing protein [Sulfurospirillum sp.]
MKKGFTLFELVMVIIIMGIVASIGADIIASLYANYVRTRTINALEAKTEITLEQIAKRLQYRIKDSTIARKSNQIVPIASTIVDDTFPIIEWIGYSNESLLGAPRPGWSGFIDLDHSDTNKTNQTLKTSESNLTLASTIMSALTNTDINLSDENEAALVFKGRPYNYTDFGWGVANNTDGSATIKVKIFGTSLDTLQVSNDTNLSEIYEQYHLAHSAFAIVPSDTNSTDFNLTLHYNYQPWLNKNYTDGNSSILTEHASLFRFRQDQTLLRFKLCLHDANQTGIGDIIVVCKEKVVY